MPIFDGCGDTMMDKDGKSALQYSVIPLLVSKSTRNNYLLVVVRNDAQSI
jgi:hypothetical protein